MDHCKECSMRERWRRSSLRSENMRYDLQFDLQVDEVKRSCWVERVGDRGYRICPPVESAQYCTTCHVQYVLSPCSNPWNLLNSTWSAKVFSILKSIILPKKVVSCCALCSYISLLNITIKKTTIYWRIIFINYFPITVSLSLIVLGWVTANNSK